MTDPKIIDGKAFAENLRARLARQAAVLKAEHGLVPGLAAVLVGADPASEVYVRSKGKATREAGMNSFEHRLPATTGEPELLDLVRSLRGSRWQLFTKIQLPNALPYIFSGMKVGSILAVAGAIVGEFLGSDRGLGYLMLQVQVTLDTAAMFMAVIFITLIGMILYGLVLLLERLVVVRDARIQ